MVQIDGLEKLLREHPFFTGFDDRHLQLLAGCCANEVFEPGACIASEGTVIRKFYLVRHGRVALELQVPGADPVVMETLEEGEIFGWSWLAPPYRWAFDATAMGQCRLVSLDAVCLREKMESDHELGYRLMSYFIPVIASRLNAARVRLLDLYGCTHDRGMP